MKIINYLLLLCLHVTMTEPVFAEESAHRVVRAIDGNTLIINQLVSERRMNNRYSFRLAGIQAPHFVASIRNHEGADQVGLSADDYREAAHPSRAALLNMALGEFVSPLYETRYGDEGEDEVGRRVGYVVPATEKAKLRVLRFLLKDLGEETFKDYFQVDNREDFSHLTNARKVAIFDSLLKDSGLPEPYQISLNAFMIVLGYAHVSKKYPSKFKRSFLALQTRAQNFKLGLWQD